MNKTQLVKKIISDSNELTKLALKARPEAHKESVMVAASIALLEVDIYCLTPMSNRVDIRTLIDDILDELPSALGNLIGDEGIGLESAIPNKELRQLAAELIGGAHNTNVLGAFDAIYNSQVTNDMDMLAKMKDGPGGETAAYSLLVGKKLFGEADIPMLEILGIINGHLEVTINVMTRSNKKAGSKACFVATACFESPEHEIVIYLRRFRDSVLKKTGFGRLFVINYYSISPHLAFLIKKNVFLRRFTAKLLRSLVWFLKKFIYKET